MADQPGLLFDRVADDYRRARPGYPDELVDAACDLAGPQPGSRVVEVGCGPGTLTTSLAARGLRVDAVDPGPRLVETARQAVGPEAAVTFHVGRFEDVELPERSFDAVFSATAFHWIEPAVGWAKVVRLLRSRGVLALLAHVHPAGGPLQDELLAAWRRVAPEAAEWTPREATTLWEGVEARRGNVSEVWAWLMDRDLARPEAAELFGEAELRRVRRDTVETAASVVAVVRTTSSYLALDDARRQELEAAIARIFDAAGGSAESTSYAVVVTARATG